MAKETVSQTEGYVRRKDETTIDVLGTEYEIVIQSEQENKKLEVANGICETYAKKLVILDVKETDQTFENLDGFRRKILRHEIIHAFLAESGLRNNSDWAENEEMVD